MEADTSSPTAGGLARILSKVHSPAAGPDGIDYSAWKFKIPFVQEFFLRGVQHAWTAGDIFPDP